MIPIKMAMYHIFRHTQMRFSSFSMHFLSFSLVNFSVWCAMRRPRQSFYHDLAGHSWRMGRLCYVCLNWFGRVCWDMPRLCLETDGKYGKYAWDSSILSAYRRLKGQSFMIFPENGLRTEWQAWWVPRPGISWPRPETRRREDEKTKRSAKQKRKRKKQTQRCLSLDANHA